MTNAFYNHSDGVPVQGSRGVSATMRNEFDLIQTGFDIAQNYYVDTGAANAMVISPSSGISSLTDGLRFWIKAANTITGATTVNLGSTLGTKDLRRVDGTAMSNEIVAGQIFLCAYNLSAGYLVYLSAGLPGASNGLPTTGGTMTGAINEAKGANIASASTVNLQTATGNIVHITGTTPITAFTLNQGARRTCIADGAFTLTHNASSLICPTGANITCAAGDVFEVFAESNNNVRITDYMRADGTSLVQFGNGGTTATGNVTLTATSPGVQVVTPAAPGYYATLPNASSLSKGGVMFSIYNAGDYDYGVKDSTGTQLGWIRPKTGVSIGLAANSAAGTWSLPGIAKTGVTAQLVNATATNTGVSSGYFTAVTIDSNRVCLVGGAGTTLYAVVYDSSQAAGSQWGAVATVRTGISSGNFLAILSAASQVLVVSCDGTTAMEAVTLTIDSTTGITVNSGTKGTATLAGNWNAFGQLKAVGSSWVVSYGRATTVSAIRAITISGTTPTIGAESAATTASGSVATAPTIYTISSSVVLAIEATATNLYAKPWTVSGTTLSAGTEASRAVTAAAYRSQALGSGNIAIFVLNTQLIGVIASVSGTVAAFSSATMSSTAPSNATTAIDVLTVSNTKLCVLYHTNNTSFRLNHLTDTAGTASAGTSISQNVAGNMQSSHQAAVSLSGSNGLFCADTTLGVCMAINVDTSGTSPVLTSMIPIATGSASLLASADIYNVRSWQNLIAGSAAYAIAPNLTTGIANGIYVSPTGIYQLPLPNVLAATINPAGYPIAPNASWIQGAFATTGLIFCKVEAAA